MFVPFAVAPPARLGTLNVATMVMYRAQLYSPAVNHEYGTGFVFTIMGYVTVVQPRLRLNFKLYFNFEVPVQVNLKLEVAFVFPLGHLPQVDVLLRQRGVPTHGATLGTGAAAPPGLY
jgi:hypothetical protein